MKHSIRIYPYFKCWLCRVFNRTKYNKCVLLWPKRKCRCNYSTAFSVWKWIVRIAIVLPTFLISYVSALYIWPTAICHIFSDASSELAYPSLALIVTFWFIEVALIVIFIGNIIINCIVYLHNEFKYRGGSYW